MAGRDKGYQNGYGDSRYPQNYGPEDGYQGDPYSGNGYDSQYGDPQYGDGQDGGYSDGNYQDGNYQDGTYQDGGYPEDAYQDDGSYQSDAYQDGNYQDGNYQDGNYQDGAYQDDGYYQEDGYPDDGSYQDDGYGQYADDYYGEPEDEESSRGSRKSQKKSGGRKKSQGSRSQRGGKKKKSSTKRIVLLVVEIAALLVVIGILYLVTRVEKVGKADLSESDLEDNISEEVKQDETSGAMKGYRQIVFFGVDSTEGQLDQKTRSDAIIIASINQESGEVKLVSVYRDTLMNLSDDTYNKCNATYAKGGPEQAINMLNMNMDLNISDFVTIGFGGLTDVINALGGVEIDVDENEITHLNNYQSTMAKELGIDYTEVTQPGLQTLNGLQATAYCRIRYTEGNDFKRTERQREVLTKVFEKIKKNPLKAFASANALMSYVKTSMNMGELFTLGVQAFRFNISESTGFPNENLRTVGYIGDQSCVIPVTLAKNVTWLHEELFGDTGYTPSQTVQDISAHVSQVSGYY